MAGFADERYFTVVSQPLQRSALSAQSHVPVDMVNGANRSRTQAKPMGLDPFQRASSGEVRTSPADTEAPSPALVQCRADAASVGPALKHRLQGEGSLMGIPAISDKLHRSILQPTTARIPVKQDRPLQTPVSILPRGTDVSAALFWRVLPDAFLLTL